MRLKVPVFLTEHPFEGAVAAILLLGLLLISADGGFSPAREPAPTAPIGQN